jgi:mRNA-degrading endonuclease toxin of MazEF toxin-antitoxin module
MAATGHPEDEGYGGGEGRAIVTLNAKQLREKEDLLQTALDAQRREKAEEKSGRRPNVIVSRFRAGTITCTSLIVFASQGYSYTFPTNRTKYSRTGKGGC